MLQITGYTVMVLAGLGVIFAIILYIASRVFKVEVDPKVAEIDEALPGVNCGACGYAGCSTFAEKVAAGEAPANGCVAGGNDVAAKLAEIMGLKIDTKAVRKVARVKCAGGTQHSKELYDYDGVKECAISVMLADGYKQCDYGCLGQGSCVKVCPFFAIKLDENKIPQVNSDRCTGCGKCVDICPKNIIELQPINKNVYVKCSSHYAGKTVMSVCEVGCIACKKCEKKCPVGAITVIDKLAVIDYSKCIDCGLCASVCPRNIIVDLKKDKRKPLEVTSDCIGCGICKRVCPVDAISGEKKQPHTIDTEICITCGQCAEKCPKNAIVEKS